MLIVNIYREPLVFNEATIKAKLCPALLEAAMSIEELNINTRDLIFSFPQQVETGNPIQKIVIVVNGFFEKLLGETKHKKMSRILAKRLGDAVRSCFPSVVTIKCLVSLDSESIFWSSDES